MATIAASAISTEVGVLVWGNGYYSVRAALPENISFSFGDSLLSIRLLVSGSLCLLCVLFWQFSRQLRNRLTAVRENPVYVELHSVRPQRIRQMAYTLLALGTAVAGMMFSLETGVTPYTGLHYFSSTVAAVLLIGRFNPILLMLVLFVITSTRSLMVFAFDSKWQEVLTYGFLFALVAAKRFRVAGDQ